MIDKTNKKLGERWGEEKGIEKKKSKQEGQGIQVLLARGSEKNWSQTQDMGESRKIGRR